MSNKILTKKRIFNIFGICPASHIASLVSALVIALHLIMRKDHSLMSRLSQNIVRPIHRFLSMACDKVPFSVAELLIAFAVIGVAVYIIHSAVRFAKGERFRAIYRLFAVLVAFSLSVYALFCVLWGTYYYGDDFEASSGLSFSPVSVEELERTTEYFAQLANKYSSLVKRDADGFYICDRRELLSHSDEVFVKVEEEFPCLAGEELRAKGIVCSRVMSYVDFTGFFFPFTGEANVNLDFPPSLFASTVAHELSHQRGVAKEQEANFVAVLASLEYGDADYCYSAALLAYTHLSNALYSADRDAWSRICDELDENILKDFALNRSYWSRFETPVRQISNTVYEGFLESYGQALGLKSYGACVDLLVNYYKDAHI